MEYTINELAQFADISTRTLRYYDQINLLNPDHINESKYRVYTTTEVDILQQIMFFKELGMSLNDISHTINSNNFDKLSALNSHYNELINKQSKIQSLLNNIEITIESIKGKIKMKDIDKFEGFKEKLLKDNDKEYGEELNQKYDKQFIEGSYKKFNKLSKYQMENLSKLSNRIDELLIEATYLNDPSNNVSKELCEAHQLWIQGYWPSYSKEAHLSLVEMYLIDDRFKLYYEKRAKGGALFLRDAMKVYLKTN